LGIVFGFSSIDGAKPGCIANGNPVAHNQCATWLEPHTIWPLAILLLVVLVTLSIGLNIYTSKLSHKAGKYFANIRFVMTLVISVIGFIVFVVMRDASQNHGSYDFGLIAANLAPGGSLVQMGPYVPIHPAAFGYGITPAMAVLLTAGYIIPAFISWHHFIFSRKHIDGQKKKVLFQ
jgi:hypothetical protein